MKHHSETHNRRSLRLQGYDYSHDGLYFITICVRDRACSLGKIVTNEMILSAIGETANQYWLEIPKHFQQVVIHEYIIMPNHVHGIIELTESNILTRNIGTRHVGTRHGVSLRNNTTESVGTSHGMSLQSSHGMSLQSSHGMSLHAISL